MMRQLFIFFLSFSLMGHHLALTQEKLSAKTKKLVPKETTNLPYKITDYRFVLNLDWTNQLNSVSVVAVVFISNYKTLQWKVPEESLVSSYVARTLPDTLMPILHKFDPRFKFLRISQIDFTKIYVFEDSSQWKEKIMGAENDFMLLQEINTVQTLLDVEYEEVINSEDAMTIDLAYNINQRFNDLFKKNKLIVVLKNKKTHTVNDLMMVNAFRYLGAKNELSTVNYFITYDEEKAEFIKTYYYPPSKINTLSKKIVPSK